MRRRCAFMQNQKNILLVYGGTNYEKVNGNACYAVGM